MATRKLPKGSTTKRPSSRGYASNRAVIENLVAPEKVAANYPSTMSGNRDVQRQAFAKGKTGVSETYKFDAKGNKIPISEAEFRKAAEKFVKQEGTGRGAIKKGQTVANAPKPSKADVIKSAVTKVQGKRGLGGDLSAAERKMAREGVAPPRKPATPPTPSPAAAPKAPTATVAPKMTRAERSAANKAKHAGVREAEMKKWAEQKAAKKPTAAKPAKAAPAPKAKPQVAKPTATPTPQVAAPKAPTKAFTVGEKAGSFVKSIGTKGGALVKNIGKGLFSAGSVGFTAATYSKELGNKAADDAMAARLQTAVRQGRRDAAAKAQAVQPTPAPVKPAKPVASKKSVPAVTKKPAAQKAAPVSSMTSVAAPMAANPEKAIADFEAKLRGAGVVSIAGGASGKAQMIQQPMSATQLEDQFKRKKGPR
jgi:hypothetical protein